MSNSLPTRIRKRDRRAPDSIINTDHVWGHSTVGGPGGTKEDQWWIWRACLWNSSEWCEDQNHREHYKSIEDQNLHTYTLVGTMTTKDRGGPLWVRRVTREHFPGATRTWENSQGQDLGDQGNWARSVQSGYQMIGGNGSGLTSNTSGPVNWSTGSIPSKGLINFGLWSPKAWNKFKPLNPKVSTSQFVAELRELPKLFIKCRTTLDFFRSLGDAYLNWEFGWKPFLKDLQAFFTEVLRFNERYEQLVRDNGKPVYRQGEVFRDIDTVTNSVYRDIGGDILTPGFETAAYVEWFGPGGYRLLPQSQIRTTTTSQKYWFAGSFKYFLQPFGSMRYQEEIARIVYGVDLTPRLLWELLPWSWLADWFTSVGDSIENLVEINLDSLVAEYAYTMGHYRVVQEDTWSNGITTASFKETSEIKARVQATPFGFGIDSSSFTTRQNAILAALALSRS